MHADYIGIINYFFMLALDVMCIDVTSNVNIAAVKIGGHFIKLSAHVDDTYFFTLDVNSLCHLRNAYDKSEHFFS